MKNDDYSYENIKNLTYLDCVHKETLRYYGPGNVIFTRVAVEDHYLKEVPIRKGAAFGLQTFGTHYS